MNSECTEVSKIRDVSWDSSDDQDRSTNWLMNGQRRMIWISVQTAVHDVWLKKVDNRKSRSGSYCFLRYSRPWHYISVFSIETLNIITVDFIEKIKSTAIVGNVPSIKIDWRVQLGGSGRRSSGTSSLTTKKKVVPLPPMIAFWRTWRLQELEIENVKNWDRHLPFLL